MTTNATRTAPPGPKPGQLVKEPNVREAFKEDRLTFLEHSTGGIRRICMPDGISIKEFKEGANEYLANYGRKILPGSLIIVVDEGNTRMGMFYCRQAIDGFGALTAVDLLEIFSWESSETAVPMVPTEKDNFIARHSNLHGYHVINTRTGAMKYTGLPSLDEAQQLAGQIMRNRART
jgi:hypothetical protein